MNYKISSMNFIQPFARKQKRSKIRRVKLGPAVPLGTYVVGSQFRILSIAKIGTREKEKKVPVSS